MTQTNQKQGTMTYTCRDPDCLTPGGEQWEDSVTSRKRYCDRCIARRQKESWRLRGKLKRKGA